MAWPEELLVPDRLTPMVAALVGACDEDVRVRAAWVGGSIARGIADDWSDIDLHLAVAEPEGFDAVAWVGRLTPLVLADRIPGVAGGFIFLTPDWVHIDVIVHPSDGLTPSGLSAVTLIDRDALLPAAVAPVPTATEPYFPAGQLSVFLYFMGNAVTVLHRGELLALSQGTAIMRDQYLVPLMLAENGVHKSDGAKRLNRYLTEEQLATLAALPAIGLDEAGLRAAQHAIATTYLTRARRLARRCDVPWPDDLERAALDLWRRELGLDLEPTAALREP